MIALNDGKRCANVSFKENYRALISGWRSWPHDASQMFAGLGCRREFVSAVSPRLTAAML
jgi:hypothetical protein